MIKILHLADVHLDAPHTALYAEKKGSVRRRETLSSLQNAIAYCTSQNIDIALISGDLFDADNISPSTWRKVIDCFISAKNTRFFISAGNHDPKTPQSFYSLMPIPDNVTIFGSKMSKIEIPKLNTCVYGTGFESIYQDEPLLDGFEVEDKSKINLIAIHGDIVSNKSSSRYNPITPAMLSNSGADYIALGHIHTYSGIKKEGQTYYAYPGSLEGRGFDEPGEHGFITGSIDKGICNLTFISASVRQYHSVVIDVNPENMDTLAAYILSKAANPKHLYKIILRGMIPQGRMVSVSALQRELSEKLFYVKIIDETKIQIILSEEDKSKTLTGIFISLMEDGIAQAKTYEEQQKFRLALQYGLGALIYNEVADE